MQRSLGIQTEFELGIRNDDAALQRIGGRPVVQRQADTTDFLRQVRPQQLAAAFKRNVFIMVAQFGLGGRRKDRLRQFLGLLQPRRQGNPADGAGGLIILPAGANQVTADHRLDRQCPEFPDHNGTALQQGALRRVVDHIAQAQFGELVGDHVLQPVKPEIGDRCEDLALFRDGIGQDAIEGGDAIGGHDQHVLRVDVIDVAHLATSAKGEGTQVALMQGLRGCHGLEWQEGFMKNDESCNFQGVMATLSELIHREGPWQNSFTSILASGVCQPFLPGGACVRGNFT